MAGTKKMVMWKYPFEIKGEFTVEMPTNSRVRHVAMQGKTPCMWVQVNPESRGRETKLFALRGTGQPFEAEDRYSTGYVGTFQQDEFVWHLFDETADD